MKEATGELNMTVITVVAIGAVAALFYAFLWPGIKRTIREQSVCANGANYQIGTISDADYVNCGALNTSAFGITVGNGQYACQYNVEENGAYTQRTALCKVK